VEEIHQAKRHQSKAKRIESAYDIVFQKSFRDDEKDQDEGRQGRFMGRNYSNMSCKSKKLPHRSAVAI